ncbi:MAG: DUF2764 family protein [Syntrophales bacterium]|nr:DUF2764 family protein [Syntrophales bacterium]NLN59345.1 DUF2764 family protein [Deltaproteobacteria bacterium]
MLNHYYYTVASLPLLSYDSEKFMSEKEFLVCCESTVTEKDFQLLKRISLVPPSRDESTHPVLAKWNSWERGLRNELVKMRAGRKGVDSDKYIAPGVMETDLQNLARDAFGSATPIEAERVLERARWTYLDNLEAGHYFDLGKLIVYYLKLQLLWRKSNINKEKGRSNFEEIYSAITGKSVLQKNRSD